MENHFEIRLFSKVVVVVVDKKRKSSFHRSFGKLDHQKYFYFTYVDALFYHGNISKQNLEGPHFLCLGFCL